MDQQLLSVLQGIQPDELVTIQHLTKDMTPTEQQQFVLFYQGKRKDEQTLLIMTLIGFFGVAGIQRFVVGQTAMGLLYLFTVGFCGIGTLVDLINVKNLSYTYNQKQAVEAASMVRMLSQKG